MIKEELLNRPRFRDVVKFQGVSRAPEVIENACQKAHVGRSEATALSEHDAHARSKRRQCCQKRDRSGGLHVQQTVRSRRSDGVDLSEGR